MKTVLELPWQGLPKPRPRVTKHGTYNPKDYTSWKTDIAELVALTVKNQHTGRVKVGMVFRRDSVTVTIEDTDNERFGRADIDNLSGGILDALQEAGIIVNDRNVTVLTGRFDNEEKAHT